MSERVAEVQRELVALGLERIPYLLDAGASEQPANVVLAPAAIPNRNLSPSCRLERRQ